MREIGGEFWDVPISKKRNQVFPDHTQWYLSGRSALQGIIDELKNCRTVAIPSWCCDSIIRPFIDAGFEVKFYPVLLDNESIKQNYILNCDVLFLMDYFGYTQEQPDLKSYKGIIIQDLTHSIFTNQTFNANYFFGSLRKWCGVWTGGYAWAKDGHKLASKNENNNKYTSLRKKAMIQKKEYICYKNDNKKYLELFNEAEAELDNVGAIASNSRDIELALNLDVDKIKKIRISNAKALISSLSDIAIFHKINDSDCPMFVPIMIPGGNRDNLHRHLIKNKIYCPIHWPISDFHKLSDKELYIYKNEISLICDQRYSKKDMNKIIKTIYEFREEIRCH